MAKVETKTQEDIHSELLQTYSSHLNSHKEWLAPFGELYVKKWEDLLKNNAEAAICEALTEIFLLGKGIEVIPNDIGNGGPDFLCRKNDKQFYVEVTCIPIEVATRKTKSNHSLEGGGWHDLLTKKICYELRQKTPQCSGLQYPCVVAIGTLHCRASWSFFGKKEATFILTGTPKMTWDREMWPPEQTTQLEDSAFVRCSKNEKGKMEYARNPISTVLLCPFGQDNPRVIGLLHPNPNHIFSPSFLPNVPFGSLTNEHTEGLFSVEWGKYNEDGAWEVVK